MQTQTTEAHIRTERTYWRRTDTPRPWWPWGLLPLLGLLLLFAYGVLRTAPHIQAEIETEVDALLRANAIAVNDVNADGQGVSIEAQAPAIEETRIRALAATTECDTWAGRLPCPTTVQVALAAAADTQRTHDFVFLKNGDEIILTGEVASDAERQRTLELANQRFARVIDRLSVSNESATSQYPLATDRALAVLDKFLHGHASWTKGVLEAGGFTKADDAQAARDLFDAVEGRPRTGRLQIRVAHAAPTTVVARPAPSPRAHDFLFIKDGNAVILTGEVEDTAERERTVRLAEERFARVIDRLSVSNEPATGQYPLAADRALAVLGKFVHGQATWTDSLFEASGLAEAEDAEVARNIFEAPRDKPNSGQIRIEVAQAATETVVPAAARPPSMARRAHDFLFIKEGDEVILTGEVPDAMQRQATLKLANAHFGKVIDRLSVSNDPATEQYPLAADRALTVLGKFISGQATWTNALFEADGLADAEGASAARNLFNETSRKPNSGRIQIELVESDRCNDAFRQALSDSTIRFRTSSAEIEEGNESLLQQLAQLARECPGNLYIDGHTDSRGDEDMNRGLSMARARAVRDALVALGVQAARLTPRGFGETQPVADNDTADGRARNRRIVISMAK